MKQVSTIFCRTAWFVLIMLASYNPTYAQGGVWTPTGNLIEARRGHTATLLADGRVLILGGTTAIAELYDPETGTFSPTANPVFGHSIGVTATRLLDGRVLLVGGLGDPTAAELYDPVTETFSPTDSLNAPHISHTATLLPDGRVLIAAGSEPESTHTAAELYDPVMGTFAPTGSLNIDRASHTATLLPNGQVLVAGGWQTSTAGPFPLSSAELFDPSTETFTLTGSMKLARASHTATLLSTGSVLVAGGSRSKEADLYDPVSGTFSSTAEMSEPRNVNAATALLNGQVLVVGGFNETSPVTTNSAELYDPATGTFCTTSSMATRRTQHAATLLSDGQVLVIGGYDGNMDTHAAELFKRIGSAPDVENPIDGQALQVGGSVLEADLASVFSDPEGEALSFSASSSDTLVATASISGDVLTVTPHAAGLTTVTITADDGQCGRTPTSFDVNVENPPMVNNLPIVTNPISDRQLGVAETAFTVDLDTVFSDPDGDTLVFSSSSSNASVATVEVSGSTLSVEPVSMGTSTITVEADDGHDGRALTDFLVEVLGAYPSSVTYTVNRSFPSATQPTSYRLVALPGAATISLASVLNGQPGADQDWRAFWDNGSEGSSEDYLVEYDGSATFTFGSGRGFWLLSKTTWSISDAVPTVTLAADGTYAIDVHPGWNIISNPFDMNVGWADVQALNGISEALHRWQDRWSTSDFVSAIAGEAFYFNNRTGLSQLKIPYPGRAVIPVRSPIPRPTQVLTLSAYHEDALASSVRIGLAKKAVPGLDVYDQMAPPGHFEVVRLHLVNASTGQHSEWASDFRPLGREGEVFDLMLSTSEATPVHLRVEGREAFAVSEIYLVDRHLSKHYNLREQQALMLPASAQPRRFSLVVGSVAFVDDAKEDMLPERITLLPNYPNPFNSSTVIEYALPTSAEMVQLKVYNLLGQRVRMLVEGLQEPGLYRVEWDATDDAGAQVASGVYLYRLQVGSFSQTKKMLRLR